MQVIIASVIARKNGGMRVGFEHGGVFKNISQVHTGPYYIIEWTWYTNGSDKMTKWQKIKRRVTTEKTPTKDTKEYLWFF